VAAALGLGPAVPAGPDAALFSDHDAMRDLLSTAFQDVQVTRVAWTVAVEPGAWFDAVAAATPRTGAVLAAAPNTQRAQLRARYVETALEQYGVGNGRVELPASAVLGSATRR
jgi:hypothetical protein